MNARFLGLASIIVGMLILALTMYVLFLPPPYISLPTIIIGVGSLVSVVFLLIAFSKK